MLDKCKGENISEKVERCKVQRIKYKYKDEAVWAALEQVITCSMSNSMPNVKLKYKVKIQR